MNCYQCGFRLSEKSYCTSCGADVYLYKKIMGTSNLFYNQGLEKANVRDLSGAIISLKQSLKFNKNNLQARNLLGLVYFEMGQTIEALSEWVISKNIQSEKNIADDYLNAVQNNPTRFDTIGQTIKKYNIALSYCKQDSKDLAVIQLRKVLSMNPKFVHAHQLLALLYVEEGKFDQARKELNRCLRIDVNNTKALLYLKEIDSMEAEVNPTHTGKKTAKEKQPQIHAYQSGNETIIQPINEKEVFNLHTIVNVLVGLVIGFGLVYFLILPGRIQKEKLVINEQLNEVSQQVVAKTATITDLEQQLEDAMVLNNTLRSEVDGYVGTDGKVELTDRLLNATYLYITEPNRIEDIAYSLEGISEEFLESSASNDFTALYDLLIGKVGGRIATSYYTLGTDFYKEEDFENASVNLLKAFRFDPTNRDALYNVANCYVKLGDIPKATETYQEVIALFPDTAVAIKAQEYLEQSE